MSPPCAAFQQSASMRRDKVRIRFRKSGHLRLVSHHDLLRCFERMLRRAALPFHTTQGFNPRPRLVFALSLPLGVVGCEEVVELELTEEVDPAEVQRRLAEQVPPGLEILSVQRIAPKTVAHVTAATYRVPLPPEHQDALTERAAALLAAPEVWSERTRPEPRRVNIRPYLLAFRVRATDLEMDVRVTPTGTARAEEILELLGLGQLLAAGAVVERARLELQDESLPSHSTAAAGEPESGEPCPVSADDPDGAFDEGKGTP